jgi:hypothetical protein
MTTRISTREWEAISAYLDGQLPPRERTRLEEQLKNRADLRAALEDLRRTRTILRSQPKLRAPRNFTLTPEMVGARPQPRRGFNLFPALSLTSALAGLLFVAVLLVDLIGGRSAASPPMSVAMQATQAPAAQEAAAQTSAPQAPALPQAAPNDTAQLKTAPEGTPLSEQPAQALQAVNPTFEAEQSTQIARMTAAPPGVGEMPSGAAPKALGTVGLGGGAPEAGAATNPESYPPPSIMSAPQEAASETASETPTVTPTPNPPTVAASVATQVETAPDSTAANASQPSREAAPIQGVPPLRALEVALGVIAVAAGVAAVFLRRSGSL